jgi:membrane fusion protein (multidrug efflux system)
MKRKLLLTLGCLVGLATLSYGIYAWHNAITYVATDDAYVEGTISPISAKVAGHVVELLVQDNQVVKKGDLLMRIDPRDFQARREQARAAVATAEANLRAARSEVPLTREGTHAQIEQARASLQVAIVGVKSAESAVDESRARLEARRSATDAMRADVSGAQSTYRQAGRELERVRSLL